MRARHRPHLSPDGATLWRCGHTCSTPETDGYVKAREGAQVVEDWILAAIRISSTTDLHLSRSPMLAMSAPLSSCPQGRLSPVGGRGYTWRCLCAYVYASPADIAISTVGGLDRPPKPAVAAVGSSWA